MELYIIFWMNISKKHRQLAKNVLIYVGTRKLPSHMPEWRNWQTHTTQNRAGNHVGSSPTLGTKKIITAKLWLFFCNKIVGLEKDDFLFSVMLVSIVKSH